MSFATILSTFEEHIKEYETAITNSVSNHHNLLGGVQALQRTLGVVKPLLEAMIPAVAPALEVADEVITDIEELISPSDAMASAEVAAS